ncbi:major facilitator superfamily domain-containing protein [Mycena filopes]|nr:major facilitator superfamily domain-containing protein [Mycena filopes]
MFIVTAILTVLTLVWWGSFSDRYGRRRLLGIISIAQLLSALVLVFAASNPQISSSWFLVVDAVLLGAVGGTASESVAVLAYLSDISSPKKRSRVFAVALGLMLAGGQLGSTLGGFVLETLTSAVSGFYLVAGLRFIHTFLVWFVLPESLTAEQIDGASIARQERRDLSAADEPLPLQWFKQLFFFLTPLSMLNPSLVAASGLRYLFASPLIVLQHFYPLFKFGWGGGELNHYLHVVTATRVVFLVLILPVGITFAHRRWTRNSPSRTPSSEREPLLSNEHPDSTTASMVDLALMRFSVLVDIVAYIALPFAPNGLIFTLIEAVHSFAAGFNPAISSLALELHTQGIGSDGIVDSGKFLAALSLATFVIPGNIVGPVIYLFIYPALEEAYPAAFFFVGAGVGVIALVLLGFIRARPSPLLLTVS